MVDYPFLPCETGGADGNIQILRLTPKGFTHQHKYFELVYVLRGKATRKLSDAMVPVSAGDYYTIGSVNIAVGSVVEVYTEDAVFTLKIASITPIQ